MTLALRLAPLFFSLPLTGCLATVNSGGGDEAAPTAKMDAGQEELRKKRNALELSEIRLSVAHMQAQLGETAATHAVAMAEAELELARQALAGTEKALAIEESELALSLDRSRQNVVESEQELSELEAMYKAEEFADMTKELVLSRGRTRLEQSKRSLELAQRRAEEQRTREFPRRMEEARLGLAKAEWALVEARAGAERGALERRVSVLEAEHALEDLRREVAELEKKAQG